MRHYEDWLKAYLKFTDMSEAPVQFHFWTAVSTIAGALRRQVWIDQVWWRWYPNFYIILVGPAGAVKKSTTVSIGHGLLREVDDVHFGPSSLTWQAMPDSFREAICSIEVDDEIIHSSALTCFISELGTFLRADNDEMVDFLTDIWDNKDEFVRRTRQHGLEEVQNPWLNIIGCTTPTWISRNIPEAYIGSGLLSRVIFVYAGKKRKSIPYIEDAIPENHYEMKKMLTEDLRDIGTIYGKYTLSKEAKEWGIQWYNEMERPSCLHGERFDPYWDRRQTHVHKLAMVIAASRSNRRVITREILENAATLVGSLESQLAYVFDSIGSVPEAGRVRDLVNALKMSGACTVEELFSMVHTFMSLQDFNLAVESGIKSKALVYGSINGVQALDVAKKGKRRG